MDLKDNGILIFVVLAVLAIFLTPRIFDILNPQTQRSSEISDNFESYKEMKLDSIRKKNPHISDEALETICKQKEDFWKDEWKSKQLVEKSDRSMAQTRRWRTLVVVVEFIFLFVVIIPRFANVFRKILL